MIPKLIWQTHELKAEDLEAFQKNIANTWNFLNPTWTHKYVNAEERLMDIENYDPELVEIYLRLVKVNQADLWRYVKVYTEGGAYADMDSVCTKPLDYYMERNYNDQQMLCTPIGLGSTPGSVNNSNFAAIKNSQILKDIIDNIKSEYKAIAENNPGSDIFENQSLTNILFSNHVIENQENVLFGFDCANHGEGWKNDFKDYTIFYDEANRPFTEIATRENWQLH
jgi:mannosyltransferase OCH1-like enzyme